MAWHAGDKQQRLIARGDEGTRGRGATGAGCSVFETVQMLETKQTFEEHVTLARVTVVYRVS